MIPKGFIKISSPLHCEGSMGHSTCPRYIRFLVRKHHNLLGVYFFKIEWVTPLSRDIFMREMSVYIGKGSLMRASVLSIFRHHRKIMINEIYTEMKARLQ